jgi:hypothetical protein
VTINVQDRAGNAVALKTQLSSASEHVSSTAITDAGANNQAAVQAYAGSANAAISGNGLQVAAIPLLTNPAGNVDVLKKGGADLMPMRGILPASVMVGTRYTATSTSSVSSGTASATLSVAVTTGFKVGGVCNLEPGVAARYESAEITAVVANTSITVAFPAGGALFTHTANYTIETFDASVAREAPGRYGAMYVSSDGPKPTYRAGAVGQTLYSTAAAVLLEIQGSATQTLRVKRIELWAQAPSANYTELQLLRCTGLSGGSATAANNGLHDTNDAAATGVVNYYTAAAASGAGHLVIGAKSLTCVKPATTAGIGPSAVWEFARNQDKALVLRGTGDVIEVYNTITGLGAGTYGFEVEWEEDNS